jgi:predicted aspartyl protease
MGSRPQPVLPSWHDMPRNWVAFQPDSLPVVWARLEQHRFRVLIDTGAARSLVAPAIASGLGLRIVGTERIIGVTGTIASVQMVELAGVGVGQIDLVPFQAGVLELELLNLGIQAILGVNAFSGRRLQIDFSAGRVYLLS